MKTLTLKHGVKCKVKWTKMPYSESQSDVDNEQKCSSNKIKRNIQQNMADKSNATTKQIQLSHIKRRPSANSAFNDNSSQFSDACSFRKSKNNRTNGSVSPSTIESSGSSCSDGDSSSSSYGDTNLPFPGFVQFSLKYLSQETKPRIWCLRLITNPYPFQTSFC